MTTPTKQMEDSRGIISGSIIGSTKNAGFRFSPMSNTGAIQPYGMHCMRALALPRSRINRKLPWTITPRDIHLLGVHSIKAGGYTYRAALELTRVFPARPACPAAVAESTADLGSRMSDL